MQYVMASVLPGIAALDVLPAQALDVENREITARFSYARSVDQHNNQRMEIEVSPALELRTGESSYFTGALRLRHDPEYPHGDDDLNRGYWRASELVRYGGHTSLELRDFYWDVAFDKFSLRLGKQQIVWGALDGIKLLDLVNPQIFQDFILREFADSRIPLWSALMAVPLERGKVEFVWTPDTTTHELAAPQSAYQFTAPRFLFGFASPESDSNGETPPRDIGGSWRDGTYASRLSVYADGWDLVFNLLYGNDFQSVGAFVSSADGEQLVARHEPRTVFGFSAGRTFGAVGLRTEIAVQHDAAFNTLAADNDPSSLAIVDRDRLGAALALDWNAPLGIFLNAQVLHDRVLDAPDRLVRPRDETLFTLYAHRRFLYETLQLELSWYTMFDRNDNLYRGALRYQFNDNLEIALEADVFGGRPQGVFGQFDDADRVLVALEYVY